jgi:predicted aldo/keto reductase-like oxidoreductase
MIYKPFKDIQLSWLGMGNMRLPKIEEKGEKIDEVKARELIEYAYQNGVNYFDTAYRYHGGESETLTGKVLEQYPRDTFYLATKMPGHMMEYKDGAFKFTSLLAHMPPRTPQEIFQEQLEKCRVDYFDFYLLHNICETAYEFYTSEEIGVIPYLLEQKKKGYIRRLAFSAHGRPETIDKFLNWSKKQFGDIFEFVQIQLNYLDWTLQDAGKKYRIITEHGLPVIPMEPCRGGKLASLNEKAAAMLKAARPNDSIASWAFRYLQSLPNIPVVLSGMTKMEQLVENVELFCKNDPATEQENELLQHVVNVIMDFVPCTECRYCCEGCPQGLDIPKLITMSNEMRFDKQFVIHFTLDAMTEKELPSACTACGSCSKLCPQGIDIPSVLKRFSEDIVKFNSKT